MRPPGSPLSKTGQNIFKDALYGNNINNLEANKIKNTPEPVVEESEEEKIPQENLITPKMMAAGRLKHARIKLDMNQADFAKSLNLHWNVIRDLETGRKDFTSKIALRIEEVHGVNTRWLLTGEGEIFIEEDPAITEAIKSFRESFKVSPFFSWICGQTNRDDAIGYLASLIVKDKDFPIYVDNSEKIRDYLKFVRNAHENLLEAFDDAWSELILDERTELECQIVIDSALKSSVESPGKSDAVAAPEGIDLNLVLEKEIPQGISDPFKLSPFYRWIIKQKVRDDAIGELAKLIAKDSSFPKYADDFDEIEYHLPILNNDYDYFIDAFHDAWNEHSKAERDIVALETTLFKWKAEVAKLEAEILRRKAAL